MSLPDVDVDGTTIRGTRRNIQGSAFAVHPGTSTLTRTCPRCGAPAGHSCRRLRSRGYLATQPRATPHPERAQHRAETPVRSTPRGSGGR